MRRSAILGPVILGGAIACLSAGGPQQLPPSSFSGARALEDVRHLVAIGPRVSGSTGAQQARAYIAGQLTGAGLRVEEQPFDAVTPLGVVKMVNLRATLDGSGANGARVIIAGHYDTKRFADFAFVGANDGGSSAALLIELGRALKGKPIPAPIELLFLDGEEAVIDWSGDDHTYGSRHYVTAARHNGTLANIRALILVDMVGDKDLRIMRESNSTRWLTDLVWGAARKLHRAEFVDEATPIEDDHLEFLQAGVPAVDIIDLDYPAWHTRDDTLDKVSAASLQAVWDVVLTALPAITSR